MSYAVTVHKPSSVRHAIVADVFEPGVQSLVLARPSALDIHSITEQGLALQHTIPINGTITALATFKPSKAEVSWLFVLTESCVCFVLEYSDGKFVTRQVLNDLEDRVSPDTDTAHVAIIEPSRRGILLYFKKSTLTYIPLIPIARKARNRKAVTEAPTEITGTLYPHFKLHIDELLIISIVFLEDETCPTIAVLYRDGYHERHVKVYQIIPEEQRLKELHPSRPNSYSSLDQGASMLLPFKAPVKGFFLLGEQILTYFYPPELSKLPLKIPFEGPINFCAWTAIDDSGERLLLGDEFGKIYMLQVELAPLDDESIAEEMQYVKGWNLVPIGETSIPTTLTYIDAGFFFVTSHFSPSTLFYLSEEEPHVRSVQTLPNLAPITDFQLLKRDNAMDVVACSGGLKSGSLRIVRSGVGVDSIAEVVGIPEITGLWTFPGHIVVASFIERTAVYKGDPEEGEVQDITGWLGIESSEPTVGMALRGSQVIHIGNSKVTTIDISTSEAHSVSLDGRISDAEFTTDGILIAVMDKLIYMSLDLKEVASTTLPNEIACLSASDDTVFVGQWEECNIVILSLPDLKQIDQTGQLAGGIPRSLELCDLNTIDVPVLLVGMADGTLYSYHLRGSTLTDQKSSVLGTRPVSLYRLRKGIFAVSSHPSMVYGAGKKISISSVNMAPPTALAVCQKSPAAMDDDEDEDIIVFATENKLIFGVVDQLMSTHIQTLEMNETARRLTIMSPSTGVIGLITVKTEIESYSGDEIMSCFVKLVDTALFEVVYEYPLGKEEMAESITSGVIGGVEYLIVGTGYVSIETEEYTSGRILVFDILPSKKLSLVLQRELSGGLYAIEVVDGKLVCAINSIVRLCSLTMDPATGVLDFKQECGFRTATIAICLSTYKDLVFVGDLIKSVTLLRIERAPDTSGKDYQFKEVARHYEPMWMTDVEMLNDHMMIGGEAEGNLVMFEYDSSDTGKKTTRDDEPPLLEVYSRMQIGQVVNRIRRIRPEPVSSVEHPIITPEAYFATREGGIYLFARISPDQVNTLVSLQENLSAYIKSPGNLSLVEFRRFRNQRYNPGELQRFVDGDYIEQFLELDDDAKEAIVKGGFRGCVDLQYSAAQMTAMVEEIKRLH
ncbi:CPSF A subunit region-domain-containing protein [Myxozyma melibiosi]|uniref:CPSF A subunit region-domain-containing protein n=1 Tax=Myxozyma melibiosi TaxID=54550 RepID=A0ABR1F097_9ASCO